MNKKDIDYYFGNLYIFYLKKFKKEHKKIGGEPVCYEEWVDNELEELRKSYRRYLKECVLEDEDFDESETEDFWDFCKEEIENPCWETL